MAAYTTASFDPEKFLKFADMLAKDKGRADETFLRVAVGRAYYAVFLMAREKLRVTGIADVHLRVRLELDARKEYGCSSQMESLFRLRSVADYQLMPISENDKDWVANWTKQRATVTKVLAVLQRLTSLP